MSASFRGSFEAAAIRAIKQNQEIKDSLQSAEYEIQQILDMLNTMESDSMISTETAKSWFRSILRILKS